MKKKLIRQLERQLDTFAPAVKLIQETGMQGIREEKTLHFYNRLLLRYRNVKGEEYVPEVMKPQKPIEESRKDTEYWVRELEYMGCMKDE